MDHATIERLEETVKTCLEFNRLKNDTDAYLHELCEWALGNVEERPDPKDYGVGEA